MDLKTLKYVLAGLCWVVPFLSLMIFVATVLPESSFFPSLALGATYTFWAMVSVPALYEKDFFLTRFFVTQHIHVTDDGQEEIVEEPQIEKKPPAPSGTGLNRTYYRGVRIR